MSNAKKSSTAPPADKLRGARAELLAENPD
jgi:hypothetical protein